MSISNHPVEHEELMAYLDGELSPERAGETASHLEHCEQCQRLAADLQEVSQMLAAWQVEEPEPEIAEDLTAAMKKRGADKTVPPARVGWSFLSPFRWPKPLWGLAAVVVIAAVVLTPSLRQMSAPQPEVEKHAQSQLEGYASSTKPQRALRAPAKVPRPVPLPRATPAPGMESDEEPLDEVDGQEGEETGTSAPATNGPMIIRSAELDITTDAFEKARAAVEEILKRHHGYLGELNVDTPTGSARSLTGTLRVPANQLDATLSDLKGLGRTENESQGGQEVTQQYVDLEARLANAKHTEQRLVEMLRDRTGKLSDVLAVEMQISRVRGEIEQMEAQRKTMNNQVDFATITITLSEAYKAKLKAVPPSTGTRLRNAAVHGYKSLVDGIIASLMWLLSWGPTLLVWAAILFFPVRMLWRKVRPKFAK